MWRKIWNDTVWSKVIAGVLLGTPAALATWLGFTRSPSAISNWSMSRDYPNWINVASWAVFLALIALMLLRRRRPDVSQIDSDRWFSLIEEKLQECSYARIYLRSFDHPDDFRTEHRDTLLRVIRTIKDRLAGKADIKIISYSPGQTKTGLDWLKAELKDPTLVAGAVQLRTTQPIGNSSSMYLFDDRIVVFNKRANGKISYHAENHGNSILFELLRIGFEKQWGEP
jgi:hypothetical protein